MGGGVAVQTGCSRDAQAEGWRAKRAYRRDRTSSPTSRGIGKAKPLTTKDTKERKGNREKQKNLTTDDTDWNWEIE